MNRAGALRGRATVERGFWLSVVLALAVVAGDPAGGEARDPDQGEVLYRQHCAVCHGFNGMAVTPDIPNFARGEGFGKSEQDLLKVMETGKGLMPAWKGILSKAEQRSVLEYARTIHGNALFEKRCAQCHNKVQFAQLLSARFPKAEEREKEEGTLEVCRGTEAQKTIGRREMSAIIRYIARSKNF